MRLCHYIKKNDRSESPSRVICLKLHVWKGATVNGETQYGYDFGAYALYTKRSNGQGWSYHFYRFMTARTFFTQLEELCRAKTRTYIFIENSQKTLTLLNLFGSANALDWTLTQAVIPPGPTIVKFRKEMKTLTFLDTSNLWPTPSYAGKMGAHERCNHDMSSDNEPCEHEHDAQEHVKLMGSLVTEWIDFLKDNDLGGFSPTVGAQAMRVFRHKYLHHPILIDCHDDALALARQCYIGARCEVLNVSKDQGPYRLVDVNSMYLSIMHDLWVPVRLIGHTTDAWLTDLESWLPDRVVLGRFIVNTDQPVYAVRSESKLHFPVGRFTACLSGPEVIYAFQHGHIEDVLEVSVYAQERAFRPFSDGIWGRRLNAQQAGNKRDDDKYKLLGNSFYGKWGQTGKHWERTGTADDETIRVWVEHDVDTGTISQFRQFGGIIQKMGQENESRESHPAIAACITAAARMKLWGLMNEAGLENVLYVDTDALLVNAVGYRRIASHVQPGKLGYLKVVETADTVGALARKTYRFGRLVRRAGVSASAVQVDGRHIEQDEDRSFSSGFRRGALDQAMTRRIRKEAREI